MIENFWVYSLFYSPRQADKIRWPIYDAQLPIGIPSEPHLIARYGNAHGLAEFTFDEILAREWGCPSKLMPCRGAP